MKYYCYILFATVFGAGFMWLAFICIHLILHMITTDMKVDGNSAKYIEGGLVFFGAIIGYLNGQNWWIIFYDKNGLLKEKYRGWCGLKLRLRETLGFLREIA